MDAEIHATEPAGKSHLSTQLISESKIPPPTATFDIVQGRSFSYVLSIDSSIGDKKADSRTLILSLGIGGFPEMQWILCLGRKSPDSTTVVKLVNQAKFKDPKGVVHSRKNPLFQRRMSSALIDPLTGSIREEIETRPNQPEQADTIGGSHWDFPSTLWEFYGRWMLYLSDDFSYEKVETVPVMGQVKTSLETVGRDTIDGRECFMVGFHRHPVRADGIKKVYWVDTAERVAVRVKDAGLSLNLIMPATDSTGTGR
jgi:hypothetical protein